MHQLPSPDAPIGVFDSGIGGLSVLQALRETLPREHFVYLADSGYAPYGERGDSHAIARARMVTGKLRDRHGIKALVVACNTATTAAIHLLRAEHPDLPLVGVEPAVKPALAETRTGRIGVIATQGTVSSAKFSALVTSLAGAGEVVVRGCDGLAAAIEDEVMSPGAASAAHTQSLCELHLNAMGTFGHEAGQMDILVLGCTHYVFAVDALRRVLGDRPIRMIETGPAVARQTARLLIRHDLIRTIGEVGGRVEFESTGDPALLEAAARKWLGLSSSCAVSA
ncbi:glutamate racemase [Xylophilus sp. GOD-11R]|uniref:glutamate racemase n=1 Tax=Xylophilus sp. GOD-11R TaxID=3089814 RepID=UPI00298BED42|nr:glutamate racemase [Xylophilus sp. GOD-11R]WPB58535.1 glutamate racemase [Xylophilus sp. GOD-11R]